MPKVELTPQQYHDIHRAQRYMERTVDTLREKPVDTLLIDRLRSLADDVWHLLVDSEVIGNDYKREDGTW